MKASQLARMLEVAVREEGDFDVIASKDQEGNGYNAVRGVDFVYQPNETEDYVFDTLEEARESGYEVGEITPKLLVYV